MNNTKKLKKTRRQFQRVIFSPDDGVICTFKPFLSNEKLSVKAASILNLSASGLQFIVKKEDAVDFQKGQRLVFKGIKGVKDLDFTEDIEMEIIWILEIKFLENIGIGCEFKNISKPFSDHIDNFVISEIKFRGQNIRRT
ncbi:MAG: PilZ domain-containing protein [Deltaproteobacteria bacterium]|nr:PilZ domain-containing protein [Deltaproteobacteria bacterium]MBW1846540.1 PilZ domain-containing protein [Deltaproteobacteria bacterium]MBW2181339.1 PilZ domain-containing protein [Deltaproteobacteria bacterium]MBW2364827.1 PilZ domain-containing protein [Deltaproteobacteria bacterium]